MSFLLILIFVPESPKWQYDQRDFQACFKTFDYMANKNKIIHIEIGPAGRMLDTTFTGSKRKSTILPKRKQYDFSDDDTSRGTSFSGRFHQLDLSPGGRDKSIFEQTTKNMTNRINLGLMIIVWLVSSFGYYLIGY